MTYIILFGLLIGFYYIYSRYMKILNKDIYKINGNLYYKVKTVERGMFLAKDSADTIVFITSSLSDQKTYCPKCAFYHGLSISPKCNLLNTHKKCPLRGKGYFIEIGSGL